MSTKLINGFLHATLYNYGLIQIISLLIVNISLLICCIIFKSLFSSKLLSTILIFQYFLRIFLHILFLVEEILLTFDILTDI
jgi:hypothetical protein